MAYRRWVEAYFRVHLVLPPGPTDRHRGIHNIPNFWPSLKVRRTAADFFYRRFSNGPPPNPADLALVCTPNALFHCPDALAISG